MRKYWRAKLLEVVEAGEAWRGVTFHFCDVHVAAAGCLASSSEPRTQMREDWLSESLSDCGVFYTVEVDSLFGLCALGWWWLLRFAKRELGT